MYNIFDSVDLKNDITGYITLNPFENSWDDM